MSLPTLSQVKDHLRLEQSETAEDDLLQNLIDAAHDYAQQYIGRSIPWDDDQGSPVAVPMSIHSAILLIIGDLYENREGKIVGVSSEVNPAVVNLLHFYRVGLGI